MTLKRLSLPGLLLMTILAPSLSTAADEQPSCSAGLPGDVDYKPADQSPLSHEERSAAAELFRSLPGHWLGDMTETVCLLSGGQRLHQHRADLTAEAGRDQLRLRGYQIREVGNAKRRFNLALFVTPDGLSVDRPTSAGGVEVIEVSPSKLAYRMNYRVTFRVPANGTNTGGGVQSSTNSAGVTSVDGATNLASGEPAATTPQAKTVKRSQLRETRVTLERVGSRELRVRQDFYVQGMFTGSNVWSLRKG